MNRLALKIALPVVVVTGALAWSAGFVHAPLPLELQAMLALGAGAATYLTAHLLMRERLERVHEALRRIRRQEFEAMGRARLPGGGDELDVFLQQVYRTGRALDREIRQLRKMENYRREFVGNVSHELKTPISVVRTDSLSSRTGTGPPVDSGPPKMHRCLISDMLSGLRKSETP